MTLTQSATTLSKIYAFLEQIGIPVIERVIIGETFLPGLKIELGQLIIDRQQLKYSGDILHEAGHIALEEPTVRQTITGNILDNPAANPDIEIAIHLWCFLACKEIRISPKVVFHSNGYKGDGDWLIEAFESQNYIGRPLLEWMGIIETGSPILVKNWIREH